MPSIFTHDPQAIKDYSVDWAAWLNSGETITVSAWTIPADLSQVSASNSTTLATVWVSGGVAGRTYRLTNHITTNQTRQDDRTVTLECREQ